MSLRERTRPGLGTVEPCLPSPAKSPPSGPGWLHEIKHDGFRILARKDAEAVMLDFMKPARPGRRGLRGGGQTRLDDPQTGAGTLTQRHAGLIRTIVPLVQ